MASSDEREVFRILGRLEAKTDSLHEDIRSHLELDRIYHDATDNRLKSLETTRAKAEGEATGSHTIPKSLRPQSTMPKWLRELFSSVIFKTVSLLLAGGGLGAVLRSLLKG